MLTLSYMSWWLQKFQLITKTIKQQIEQNVLKNAQNNIL